MQDRIEDRNQPTQPPEPGEVIRRWLQALQDVETLRIAVTHTARTSTPGVAA